MKKAALVLDNHRFIAVQVARGVREKMQGLSNQTDWDGTPLVFQFSHRCRPAFWMHQVSFPLDMVWVADGKVVGITRDLPPAKSRNLFYNLFFLKRYHPPRKIDMAIEVPAGEVRQLGILTGQTITLAQ